MNALGLTATKISRLSDENLGRCANRRHHIRLRKDLREDAFSWSAAKAAIDRVSPCNP